MRFIIPKSPASFQPSGSDNTGELEIVLLSQHPLVVIETIEEVRACQTIDVVCDRLGFLLFEWSVTTGLVSEKAQVRIPEARDLPKLFETMTVRRKSVFLLKDLGPNLATPRLLR